ncbi:MAG: Gfo/Idh/MocA family oxidoreductase, partial [Myxococcales bacterium]
LEAVVVRVAVDVLRVDAVHVGDAPGEQSPDATLPEVTRKLGWAIVGLGKLAIEEIIPAFATAKHSRLVALVSGHADKARRIADVHGVDPKNIYSYANYDSLKDNPAVDIIYIVLPNSMHAEYTIRGFQAGKHVLCEKPMAPSLEDCQRMIDAGKQAAKKLMIAYRLHYEPATQRVTAMCKKRELGLIRSVEATNVQVTRAPNIRLSSKLGGGPLGDLGIYCINGIRYALGEEPTEVTGSLQLAPDRPDLREVPAGYSFTMRFPSGVVAHADTNFTSARSNHYRIHCERGYLDVDEAYSYDPPILRVNRDKEGTTQVKTEKVNQFTSEMDHFSRCVLDNKESDTPGAEGLADMRVVKAIEEAARTGATVKVAS